MADTHAMPDGRRTAPLVAAAVVLALASVLVIIGLIGAWRGDGLVESQSWEAGSMSVAFGSGELEDGALVITGTQQNVAVVRVPMQPFDAGAYVYADLEFENAGRHVSVMLTWNGPSPERSVELIHTGVWGGLVRLDRAAAWNGEITRLELVAGGADPVGVRLKRLTLSGHGATQSMRHAVTETTRVFNRAASISAIDFSDGRRPRHLQLAPLAVAVSAFAWLWFVVLGRLFGRAPAPLLPMLGGFLLIGWLLLDLRWQWELSVHTARVWDDYAGQPWLQRYRAMGNGDIAEFLFEAREHLPEKPAWVVFSGDAFRTTRRGPHFLYPHSAVGGGARPGKLQPGDFVILFRRPNPRFDSANGALRWEDGASAPARLIWRNDAGGVYEVTE